MSRIGKKPVAIPSGVTATVSGPEGDDEGPQGRAVASPVRTQIKRRARRPTGIEVSLREETNQARAMWGMARTQIVNLIDGVTKGYSQHAGDPWRRLPRGA